MDAARAEGLDVQKIMTDAFGGYEKLKKMKVNRFLVDHNIRNEWDMVIHALNAAIKQKNGGV